MSLLSEKSGTGPFGSAPTGAAQSAAQAQAQKRAARTAPASRASILVQALESKRGMRAGLPLRTAHAGHRGDVAMRLAADIVFEPHVIALIVDEARLPIARVIFRIVDGDDVLDLGRADLADALDRVYLVGVGRAGGVHEGLFIEPRRLHDQRVAVET